MRRWRSVTPKRLLVDARKKRRYARLECGALMCGLLECVIYMPRRLQ